MIKGFENFTHELNTYEKDVLVPLIANRLQQATGSKKAVTNNTIANHVMLTELKRPNGARVRKVISHIRKNRIVPNLIATSNGYYVAETPEELKEYIYSLGSRIYEILRVKKSMERDYRAFHGEVSKKATPKPQTLF